VETKEILTQLNEASAWIDSVLYTDIDNEENAHVKEMIEGIDNAMQLIFEFEAREQRLSKLVQDLAQVTSFENYQETDEETDEVTTWKLGEVYYNLTDLAICDFNEASEIMDSMNLEPGELLGSNLDLITIFQDYITPILNELNYLTEEIS